MMTVGGRVVSGAGDFRFSCPITVRFRDLDAMGHVNNAVYFTYFEVGREGYTKALGHVSESETDPRRRYPFILAKASCTYLASATAGETLDIHIRTAKVGQKSFDFAYLITNRPDGRAIATGSSTMVAYDYVAGRTVEIPEGYLECIERLEGRPLGETVGE